MITSVYNINWTVFGGAFAKLKLPLAPSCQSVCLSIRPTTRNNLAPLDIFSWNFIFQYFTKISLEDLSFFKSDKINGFSAWKFIYISNNILLPSSLDEKCFRQYFYKNKFSENLAVFEMMWKVWYIQTAHRWHYSAVSWCVSYDTSKTLKFCCNPH